MKARPHIFVPPDESWMGNAKCKGLDPHVFFPPDGHNLLPRPAIEVCNVCPVQMQCLDYALTWRIDDGVWGGTTRNDRRRILRARKSRLRLANPVDPPADSGHG